MSDEQVTASTTVSDVVSIEDIVGKGKSAPTSFVAPIPVEPIQRSAAPRSPSRSSSNGGGRSYGRSDRGDRNDRGGNSRRGGYNSRPARGNEIIADVSEY